MKFVGYVFFRSSKSPAAGPPGEAEVLELNPQRKIKILRATGWIGLETGSLNLKVDRDVVAGLEQYVPIVHEDGAEIIYPPKFQHIPKLREGYWYYEGVIYESDKTEEVLIRRAINPMWDRLELFAQINLKTKFGLKEKDPLTVQVVSDLKTDPS